MKFWPKIQIRKAKRENSPRAQSLMLNEAGSVLVEAAVGLPVLLSAIIGILEIGNYVFLTAAVENAVLHASRFGVTGLTEEGSSRLEQIRGIVEEHTFGQVNMDTVEIDTLVYAQFSDIGQPEPFTDTNSSESWDEGEPYVDINGNGSWDDDMGSEGLGGGGDIVVYRVNYTANSLTGAADWATHSITISSTVAVRNEPY